MYLWIDTLKQGIIILDTSTTYDVILTREYSNLLHPNASNNKFFDILFFDNQKYIS